MLGFHPRYSETCSWWNSFNYVFMTLKKTSDSLGPGLKLLSPPSSVDVTYKDLCCCDGYKRFVGKVNHNPALSIVPLW